ncbi:hypothetical protein [Nocardia rhizosphaerihabitans]|uniref:Tetracycline repressor TetR C-terminal domain-containing protein n=1 Tax=Nocardia rhizosphaerihabitans TaxID=1691570 RepID=A0ABQ2K8N6_9NOCA|nr:hypothetical protein [Nocardia rhizosphaerihabitans]GGN71644.1 hypothetical protein GCM10011610_12150 [Nocardia rhizosphaerihabitans]
MSRRCRCTGTSVPGTASPTAWPTPPSDCHRTPTPTGVEPCTPGPAERRPVEQFDEATALRVYQQEVAARLDPGRFPEIEQLFADQAFADVPPDQESAAADFRFGLDLILDGVDAAISR